MRTLSALILIALMTSSAIAQSVSFTGTVAVTGTATATGAITPSSGIISNSTCGTTPGGMDGPAALPLAYLCSSEADTPRTTPTTVTVASGQLQADYNAAACGTDLQLTAGQSYSLSTAAGKSCPANNWIWIRTAPSANLPAEGVTTNPCYSNVSALADYPGIVNCPGGVAHQYTAAITVAPGSTINATGADHIRFENIQIAKLAGAFTSDLITLVTANNIVFDRIWFHGNPGEELTRAVIMDGSSSVSFVDNFFSDIHNLLNGSASGDSQNIEASTAPGPFKISHNFLSAGDEQIELGGGGFAYGVNSDIEVSYNHSYRPFTWAPGCTGGICPGGVNYNGGTGGKAYSVKNNFECKNCNRVLLFGNEWEDVFFTGSNQVANSTTLTPKNQAQGSSNLCPSCQVTNITERYDFIHYAAMPFQIDNVPNGNGAYATAGNSYSFHDIVADHGGNYVGCGTGCATQLISFGTATAAPSSMYLNNVTMNHLTLVLDTFPNSELMEINGPISPIQQNMVIQNSILPSGQFGIGAFGGGGCNVAPAASTPKLVACWNPLTFTNNGIPWAIGTSCSGHGCGGTWSGIGGSLYTLPDQNNIYTNQAAGNYTVLPTSILHNGGTDGTDVGANIGTLNSYLANVPYP